MQKFFDWWVKQLLSLLPEGTLRAQGGLGDTVILDIEESSLRLLIRARGVTTILAEARADEAGFQHLAKAAPAPSEMPRSILLRLPGILKKRVALPSAARGDLDAALGFEIDRETPFASDEVYWSYSAPKDALGGKLTVDLFLVPRAIVDPLLDAARRAGFAPSAIEAGAGNDSSAPIRLGAHPRGNWLRAQRPLMPLAAAAAGLAFLAVITPFIVQQWALASTEAAIASLGSAAKEAASMRQSADQVSRGADLLNQERARNGSALATLAAVTRALPDDSHLTSFSLRGGKLTITGLSSSAAQLIGVLAKSKDFHEPAFEAPVVQDQDNDLESFTISVALGAPATP